MIVLALLLASAPQATRCDLEETGGFAGAQVYRQALGSELGPLLGARLSAGCDSEALGGWLEYVRLELQLQLASSAGAEQGAVSLRNQHLAVPVLVELRWPRDAPLALGLAVGAELMARRVVTRVDDARFNAWDYALLAGQVQAGAQLHLTPVTIRVSGLARTRQDIPLGAFLGVGVDL